MVKVFSAEDSGKIHEAVMLAEQSTSAEIAVVVTRASDEYRAVSLLCGLALGIATSLAISFSGLFVTPYMPLSVQLAVIMMFQGVPFLRHLCIKLEPAHYLKRRAAQRAATEYLHLVQQHPSSVPVVMIYISVAERYVHIHASRSVQEKIPVAQWDAVVATLTKSVHSHGLASAVVKAVAHAGDMLKQEFPNAGVKHAAENVVEIED